MTGAASATPPPRRILMTTDCVGGVWNYSLTLARALAPGGTTVHLATMGRLPSAAQRVAAAGVPNVVLHTSEYRLEWMEEPWDDVRRAAGWLQALEQQVQPDIIHVNGYAHGAVHFHAPTLVVAHSCVCSWWRAVRGEEAPRGWDTYRAVVAAGLRAAGAVAAPTRVMLEALEQHYDVAVDGVVIPNGADAPPPSPGPRDPFVLSAGRAWDEGKNVGAVARAARDAAWSAFIAGDIAPPEGADGHGSHTAGAEYLGMLAEPELARWMRRAAVYALPARYEPFGLSALEAALAGCALVLGDIPTLREVWGDAPLWVEPGDTAGLRRVVDCLMDDATLRQCVAARCADVARGYSTTRMRDGYLRQYASLQAGGDAPLTRARAEAACV